MDKEVWKDVKGYEGYYQVSNYGRVRSVDRVDMRGQHRKGKVLANSLNSGG
ncbi:NUMOD4 domain-containing protein, partial [Lacticaseibacillus rhamnosus]